MKLHLPSALAGACVLGLLALLVGASQSVTAAPVAPPAPAAFPGTPPWPPHPANMWQWSQRNEQVPQIPQGGFGVVFQVPADKWLVIVHAYKLNSQSGIHLYERQGALAVFKADLAETTSVRPRHEHLYAIDPGVLGWTFAPGSTVAVKTLAAPLTLDDDASFMGYLVDA